MDKIWNREKREISEPQSALGEGYGFYEYFAYFAVQEIARAGIWENFPLLTVAGRGCRLKGHYSQTYAKLKNLLKSAGRI